MLQTQATEQGVTRHAIAIEENQEHYIGLLALTAVARFHVTFHFCFLG